MNSYNMNNYGKIKSYNLDNYGMNGIKKVIYQIIMNQKEI